MGSISLVQPVMCRLLPLGLGNPAPLPVYAILVSGRMRPSSSAVFCSGLLYAVLVAAHLPCCDGAVTLRSHLCFCAWRHLSALCLARLGIRLSGIEMGCALSPGLGLAAPVSLL